MLLELTGISKKVKNGREDRIILDNLYLQVKRGSSIAIKGRSGAGKTTLLNIIGGILPSDSGRMFFDEKDISNYTNDERLEYRKKHIGFITQQLNLLDDRNVYENIALPLKYSGFSNKDIKQHVQRALVSLRMENFEKQSISTLSGGERQRIAIARAIVKNPSILLADEPTGSLDEETEKDILTIFKQLQSEGMTIIIVTHDNTVANYCNQTYELSYGTLKEVIQNKSFS